MARHYTSTFNTRQHMQDKELEVFYYEDKLLQPVSSHSHDHYEFYFFISGSASCSIDKTTYPLSYGDICLMPPGVYHQPVFHDMSVPYRRIVLWISKEYFDSLKESFPGIDYCITLASAEKKYHFANDSGSAQILFSRLFDLIEEYHLISSFRDPLMKAYTSAFLLHLDRVLYNRIFPVENDTAKPLFSQICDHIHTHLSENLSLEVLAEQFFVSKYYIAHTFKENMGLSTHQYILKKRLHASKGSILAGMPLNEVSDNYGFQNYATFFRAFKKEFGISPREFKDTCRLP